jgi:hypothetical protein
MNNIADLINPDFKKDDYRLARDMVDLGMSLHGVMTGRIKDISDLYRMYHGRYTDTELIEMTTVHGEVSSTPLKANRLAKVKIDQLLNESLEVGFSVEVDTISPVEKQKKADEAMKAKGRSYAKPIIESVREQGYNIYEGIEIPDFDLKMQIEEFRTRNELISQRIINEKVKDAIMRHVYYYVFSSNIFASEMFTRSVIDRKGHSGIEYIAPERMIYPQNIHDQFNESVPIIGHWTQMTFVDIIRDFDIKKDSDTYKQIVQAFNGNHTGAATYVPMNSDGTFNFEGKSSLNQSQMTCSVYYFQWRYYVDKVVKKQTDGNMEYLDPESVKEDLEANPAAYTSLRLERLYQGATLNGQVYFGFGDVKDYAITRDAEGRIRASYDYISTLVKTFGGERTSFAKIMYSLDRQYDKARWMLFREIGKTRNNAIYIDDSYLGKQSKSGILHDLDDKGILTFSSKDKFNETGEQILDGKQIIGAVNSGSSSSMISELISICIDIERVADSITGINAARKGTEKATTTATTSENNLQASRSVTYDNFYFAESHMQRAFTHLIQKTKSAIYAGSKEAYAYLSPDDIAYLEESPDYFKDNFQARIVGGRRSQQIFAELNEVVKSEVAAGKRSSTDFAVIRQSDSLREAVEVLRAGDERLTAIQQKSEEAANQAKLQMNQNTVQASMENREDEQASAKEIQDSINTTKLQDTQMKIIGDLQKQRMQPPSLSGNSNNSSSKTKK